MALFKKSGPPERFVTAWGVTFIDPHTRVPIQKVLVSLTSYYVIVADYLTTRPKWVRKVVDLDEIIVGGNQLLLMFADRRGYQAMTFDFDISDSDNASVAAKRVHDAYLERMAELGRTARATLKG